MAKGARDLVELFFKDGTGFRRDGLLAGTGKSISRRLTPTTDEIGAKLVEHVRGFDELNLQDHH